MLPGSAVIRRINDQTQLSTRVYTADADPGYELRVKVVDNTHSQTWWQSAHIQIATETHTDIWKGCFIEATGTSCAQQDGSNLGAVGQALVRFTACGVLADPNSDCASYAKQ